MTSQTDLRVFTVEEANRSIDELRKTFRALRGLLRSVEKMESRLQILELICNRSVTLVLGWRGVERLNALGQGAASSRTAVFVSRHTSSLG